MATYKMTPDCDTCPKNEGYAVKQPLADDVDFGDWFWDLRDSYREGKVCGFNNPDPLLRACYAIIAEADAVLKR